MELVLRSRFIHFVIAVRDFSKDEPDEEFVGNNGGSFETADDEDDESDTGSVCEPLDRRFGFRSTRRRRE